MLQFASLVRVPENLFNRSSTRTSHLHSLKLFSAAVIRSCSLEKSNGICHSDLQDFSCSSSDNGAAVCTEDWTPERREKRAEKRFLEVSKRLQVTFCGDYKVLQCNLGRRALNRVTPKVHKVKGSRRPLLNNIDCRRYSTTPQVSTSSSTSMDLKEVVSTLKGMASPSLAGSWDNVGLLVEPSPPHYVGKILLTNDLTPPVMEEAVSGKVDMIVSYHPPIFTPLKRITQGAWKERIVGQCLEKRIAMYSPHTSWDAAVDGVNDWLIRACGDVTDVKPLEQTEDHRNGLSKKLSFITSSREAETVLQAVHRTSGVETQREILNGCGAGDAERVKISVLCREANATSIMNILQASGTDFSYLECTSLAKLPSLGFGMGRIGRLNPPVELETAITHIKKHLGLQHVQLAQAEGVKEISTVAVCAGSGSSVLRGVKADLYLTGEMSHHEILDSVYRGTHVILCNHSNSERGFLQVIQSRLSDLLGGKVEVIVSQRDRDPLVVV